MARKILLGIVTVYQRLISPVLPSACKFYPTCSEYARQAIEEHGAGHGVWLAARRLLRCRPFSRGGYDPVPGSTGAGPSVPRVPPAGVTF